MTPELRWLSDPTVFAVNRLDAHSDHLCCRTLDEAESGLTSLRQSLDGAWRFAWSANPAARPADFWQPDADLSGFGTIRVPGHIELQGYGQLQLMWGNQELRVSSNVIWVCSEPSAFMRQTCISPVRTELNQIYCPQGEYSGPSSKPSAVVRRFSSPPREGMT